MRFYGIRNSTDIECVLEFARVKTCFEITRVQCVLEFTRVQTCIWLRTPFGWKEIVRGAREFIRWTVKTFDRRGW
jgi:hypothetical protein